MVGGQELARIRLWVYDCASKVAEWLSDWKANGWLDGWVTELQGMSKNSVVLNGYASKWLFG